tara:strand:- start:11485 stop:11943 length:459 start_codon:yes stop_codon:yes gene_type:complete
MNWYKSANIDELLVPGRWIVINDNYIGLTGGHKKKSGRREYISVQTQGSGCKTCDEKDFKIPSWIPIDQKMDIYSSLAEARKALEGDHYKQEVNVSILAHYDDGTLILNVDGKEYTCTGVDVSRKGYLEALARSRNWKAFFKMMRSLGCGQS